MKLQAQHLRNGDIMKGSGEKVIRVSAGVHTPKGKTEVHLHKNDKLRFAIWGKFTMVSIEDRPECE